jgi:cyclopropane-fatty-acyl-phospholipid synthase
MIPHAGAARLSARAADVLRQVFATVQADFAFRLWDGALVAFGAGPPAFTVVIYAPETFLRLMRDPTPLVFGEAYVGGDIDIDGDLFAAMHVANALENLRLPLAQRLRLLLAIGPAALRARRRNGTA